MKLDMKEAADILGLAPNASEEDIKKAYRQLSKQTHPDKNGTAALFNIVKEAYDTMMSDLSQRTAHNRPHQNSQNASDTTTYAWTDATIPLDVLYHVYLNQRAVTLEHNGQTVVLTPHDLGQFPEDFVLPFNSLKRAADGNRLIICYQKFRVSITPEQAAAFSIKSYLPMEITVSSWPTWLHKLFRRKPKETQTTQLDYKNNAYNHTGNHQSLDFQSRMNADLNRGYHEITLKFLDQVITVNAHLFFKHKSVVKEVRYYTRTDHPIRISADVVFRRCP